MRAVIQRVKSASVTVEGEVTGEIEQGLVVLLGIEIADTDELPARARNTLVSLMRDFARWRDLAKSLSPAELARTLLDESGYTAVLQAEKTAQASGRLENLAELARAMEDYETLGDFLEHVSLVMDNDAADDVEKVTIMTIHAAKGLEFDNVFLPGWEEGVFPSQRALDEGGLASLEEERRLAYVAITRARRRCTILHAANRRIYGQWNSAIPSRFVAELPDAHVDSETTMTGGASLWRAQWSERGDPFADVGVLIVGQPLVGVQFAQRLRIRLRRAAPEPDLRQPRALAHQHRKGLRPDLGIERPVVAGADMVEARRAVGDHAGEHVEAAGRAFRIGRRDDVVRQRKAFKERHDVDAVRLQHRAAGQRKLVQLEFGDAPGDRGARPRQEARAHPVGHGAEPQIEARGLDLVRERRSAGDLAGGQHGRDPLGGDHPGAHGGCEGDGRASEIRTHDLSTPSRTRYQTAL